MKNRTHNKILKKDMKIKIISKSQIYSILVILLFALKVVFNCSTIRDNNGFYSQYSENEAMIKVALSTFNFGEPMSSNFDTNFFIRCLLLFLITYFNMKKLKELGFKNYSLFLSFFMISTQIYLVIINIIFLIITINKAVEEVIIKWLENKKNKSYFRSMPDKFEKTLILGCIFSTLIFCLFLGMTNNVVEIVGISYLLFIFLSGFINFEKYNGDFIVDAFYMCHMTVFFTFIFLDLFTNFLSSFLALYSFFIYLPLLITSILVLCLGNFIKEKISTAE